MPSNGRWRLTETNRKAVMLGLGEQSFDAAFHHPWADLSVPWWGVLPCAATPAQRGQATSSVASQ